MRVKNTLPDRRTARDADYDYRKSGYYFVTICIENRVHAFGEVDGSEVRLSREGRTSEGVWLSLPERWANVGIDAAIFMPNHMHGIVVLKAPPVDVETSRIPECFKPDMKDLEEERLVKEPERYVLPSVGEVVRTFKGASTRLIRKGGSPDFAWQERYWVRVLKTEEELASARGYIQKNPRTWREDKLYSKKSL